MPPKTETQAPAAPASEKLLDLYEPLLQYVCLINRMSRKGSSEKITYDIVRKTVSSHLDAIHKQAEVDPLLALQAEKLELPILFFVDSLIAESKLECAKQWNKNRLAFDKDQLAGDEKFFDMLDETLNDTSREATERLKIYYVCLGLGFTGWYSGQPEYLRKKMEFIAKRISSDRDPNARICPEAYQFLDKRNLIEPPAGKIGMILLALLVLSVMTASIDFYLFRIGSEGLVNSLKEIERHDLFKPL